MVSSSAILQDILQRLERVRHRQNTVDVRRSALQFGTILIGELVLLPLLEWVLAFPGSVRAALVVTFLAVNVPLVAWFILRPLLRLSGVLKSSDDFQTAESVGGFFPNIRDRLLNLLQLHREIESGKSLYSPELVDASFQDLAKSIENLDFTSSVDSAVVNRSAKTFALSAASALLLFAAFSSPLSGAFYRLIHFQREFTLPPDFIFTVSPGNKEVLKGENVHVSVQVEAASVLRGSMRDANLRLYWRPAGQVNYEQMGLRSDSNGVFRSTLQSVRATTEYFVELADFQSNLFRLTVIDRPVIRSLQIRLDYPAYTKLPPRIQDEFVGDVSALPGTKLTLSGSASKELVRGSLEFDKAKPLLLSVRGVKFSASFSLLNESSYHIQLTDAENLTNADPVKYQLTIIPDEYPSVSILQPGRNIDLAGDNFLRLVLQAKDDFGVSRLQLGYRLIHSRYEPPQADYSFVSVPIPSGNSSALELPFTWDFSKLKLAPEDVVEYFAEVFDNDLVRGPKSAKSPLYLIRLPSIEEVFAELDRSHETSLDNLKQSLEEAKQLKEKIESIDQDFKKNKDPDWQQQKKLEEMAKKYQELQKKLEDVKSRVDEMVQKMTEQNVLSKETLEKYLELQQMFEQLNSEELQRALRQMQQAMQNINREQLQQALQKMTFSEERFRQSIERTINLLKRIQIEQKLDQVKKRAQEAGQLQKDLKEATAQSENDAGKINELAQKQNDLSQKEEQLEKEVGDLQHRMEEFFTEMPVDKLEQMAKELSDQKLAEQMRQAAQQMRQGQPRSARAMQQQIQQQLQQFSQNIEDLQNQMLQQQAQYIMNELRRAINNLLELSKREEALKQESQNAPPNSSQLRENAENQMGVMQDLGNVIKGLSELSQRSFVVTPEMGKSIGEALARMQNAMRSLDTRLGSMASQEQGGAMASLNRAATQVQNALQAMIQGGGSGMGSLMQQLQMMAGQQMGINMRAQQLGQGEMSMEQAAQAARLAVEQEAVRKSLEQLNKEAQASGDQQRLLGDLEKIGEEMKEVVKNLEQSNVNPETVQKEERILSRLLDASRSMHERDFEKRRRATTGTQIARKSPGELDPSMLEGRDRLREDLLKALEQGYSKDYQELIRKYFEALQNTPQRENR